MHAGWDVHLHVLDLGLGQQQLLVVVALPLLTLGLQLQHGLLGVGEPLAQVCDLEEEESGPRGNSEQTHIWTCQLSDYGSSTDWFYTQYIWIRTLVWI